MEKQRNALNFSGEGLDFFLLLLKNLLLTVITLGIYSFWAKVEVQKYLSRHTFYLKESFDFHGTGKEKFIGFLKGMGLLIAAAVVYAVLLRIVGALVGMDIAQIIMGIAAYVAILALVPMIIVGQRRYFLSRSSWRGVRFIFAGKWQDLAKIIVRDGILSVLTLGIYIPWFIFHYEQYKISRSCFGTEKFSFDGEAGEFVKIYFKGLFLSIITVGIYLFWFEAAYQRYIWNHTSFQGKKMDCTLSGGTLFVTAIVNILIVVFTLSLGTAWALMRIYRVTLGSIALNGDIDFESIKAAWDEKASALADGVSDASDLFDSISNMIS